MIEFLGHSGRVGFIAAALTLLSSANAFGLEPETADLISSTTVEVPSSFDIEEETAFIGIKECKNMVRNEATLTTTWESAFDPTTADGRDLVRDLWYFGVERGSGARIDCKSGELCAAIDDEDVDYTSSAITAEVTFFDLTDLEDTAACAGFDREYFVRVTVREDVGSDTTENADARYVVDTTRPTAPSGLTTSVTEDTIEVEFEGSADEDTARYFVFWSSEAFEGGANPDDLELNRSVLGEDPSGDVPVDFKGDETIFVAVAAQDEAGNFSALSGVVETSVVATNDFWEEYKAAGGQESGCSTARGAGSGWLVLFVLGLIFGWGGRRRRRRFASAVVVCLGVLALAPQTASAETPTYGAFELKLGTYYPNIDSEFGDSGPFSDIFGTKNLVMGEIEVDGWIWQGFGKAGVAASFGFSRVKGTARAANPDNQSEVSDTTSFGVMPFRVGAMYRFDWLALHTKIPLSFNLEGGFDFYRWRIADSNGNTAEFDGESASGWKPGYHLGGGVQLLLDFLDTATAAAFDLNWGINNSYLFAEYLVTRVDGFGAEGFDLSDNIWLFGLSFEF